MLPIVLDLAAYDAPALARWCARLYGDGRRNILFVGRIIPNKRIDDLIRVFAVYQRYVRAGAAGCCWSATTAATSATSTGSMRDGRARCGCDEVVFTGHVDDDELLAYYAAADVFLCLSEHEGFCVPLLEAMHFGRAGASPTTRARCARRCAAAACCSRDKPPELVAELLGAVVLDDERCARRSSRSQAPGDRERASDRLRRAAARAPRAGPEGAPR